MTLIYGYEMDSIPGQVGHVISPPLLSTKITLSSAGNTTRWIFFGKRQEIIDWLREHSDIILENTLFVGESSGHTHTEIVIDLQQVNDSEQSYYDYIKSFFVNIYDVERVKVEIRPRVESKDNMITCLNRAIVASGTRLGDIVDDLQTEWFKPAESYVQQAAHLLNDEPTPSHVLSAKPPSSIQITNESH
ncbi:hypothetical protein RMATCC62417_11960 [Rhizopus microsporus]|nr:hypothetical protein RMATCC62417_11960 [Rhizopus microsporus]